MEELKMSIWADLGHLVLEIIGMEKDSQHGERLEKLEKKGGGNETGLEKEYISAISRAKTPEAVTVLNDNLEKKRLEEISRRLERRIEEKAERDKKRVASLVKLIAIFIIVPGFIIHAIFVLRGDTTGWLLLCWLALTAWVGAYSIFGGEKDE
jgi:tetrahydromethanopterin S-methyltransferase subunit G